MHDVELPDASADWVNWPVNKPPLPSVLYWLMIRASCESRRDVHPPSQSSICELPTVGSRTLSRLEAASAVIGNVSAGNGEERCQLPRMGQAPSPPPSLVVSQLNS